MKDFLQDLISHTNPIDGLSILRIKSSLMSTEIESMTEDRSMILKAKSHTPIDGLVGTFGMGNLNKLDLHLKCPEYQENAKIYVDNETKDNDTYPAYIHFSNENNDFKNSYRLVHPKMLDIKLKNVSFKEPTIWDIEFEPSKQTIDRFKYQVSAHSEELHFHLMTDNNNLIIKFGDVNSHAGSFVLLENVGTKLYNKWVWSKAGISKVLRLNGNKRIKILDAGAFQISVDSGLVEYNYIFRGLQA